MEAERKFTLGIEKLYSEYLEAQPDPTTKEFDDVGAIVRQARKLGTPEPVQIKCVRCGEPTEHGEGLCPHHLRALSHGPL